MRVHEHCFTMKLLCKGRRHGVVTTQGGRRWYIQPSTGIKGLARHRASFSGLAASPHPLCDCQLQVMICVKPNSEHLVPPAFTLSRAAGDKPSMFCKNARESKTMDFLPWPRRNTTPKKNMANYGKSRQLSHLLRQLAVPAVGGNTFLSCFGNQSGICFPCRESALAATSRFIGKVVKRLIWGYPGYFFYICLDKAMVILTRSTSKNEALTSNWDFLIQEED